MADVFISYASEDRERARKLSGALEAQGWSVWWDRKIIVGESYDQAIEHELESAKSVVVLWSKDSIHSDWVKNEAGMAVERGVLVPAIIDRVKLPLEFRRRQTADLVGWDGSLAHRGFQALCSGIAATADVAPVAARQPAAKQWGGFRSQRRWLLGAVAVSVAVLCFVAWWGVSHLLRQENAGADSELIDGIWYGDIQYSWGASEIERFDFTRDGEQLFGTASFGQASRQIVDGRISNGRLYFRTQLEGRSLQYRGEVDESRIQFTLDNQGEPPTRFVAARSVEAARRLRPRQPTGGTDPRLVNIVGGGYQPDHLKATVGRLQVAIRQCYVASEFDSVEHAYVNYFVRIARDGTVKETGAPGDGQRSVELDRCMDRAFKTVNWGAPPTGGAAEIRLGFEALPAWRSQ